MAFGAFVNRELSPLPAVAAEPRFLRRGESRRSGPVLKCLDPWWSDAWMDIAFDGTLLANEIAILLAEFIVRGKKENRVNLFYKTRNYCFAMNYYRRYWDLI